MIHTINPLCRTSSKPYTNIHLILKTGICLCDSYFKSPGQNLQQTLYKNYLDFENGDLFVWFILWIPFSESPTTPIHELSWFWKRGFVCVIHTLNPLFRTSSKPYTQIILILRTGICLCDSCFKSPFQSLQQTLYKKYLDFEHEDLFVWVIR